MAMATPSDIHQSSGCLKAREKKKSEISKLEADLSKFDRQTVDPAEYKAYLVQKQRTDKLTSFFYKWRGWKLRNFCYRRSSKDKLVNRIRNMYGPLCKVYFGDWSSRQVDTCTYGGYVEQVLWWVC